MAFTLVRFYPWDPKHGVHEFMAHDLATIMCLTEQGVVYRERAENELREVEFRTCEAWSVPDGTPGSQRIEEARQALNRGFSCFKLAPRITDVVKVAPLEERRPLPSELSDPPEDPYFERARWFASYPTKHSRSARRGGRR